MVTNNLKILWIGGHCVEPIKTRILAKIKVVKVDKKMKLIHKKREPAPHAAGLYIFF